MEKPITLTVLSTQTRAEIQRDVKPVEEAKAEQPKE